MTIQGLRTTANFIANARPENWREGIMLLYPNGMAPLTALTSLMGSQSVDDPHFHWFEKAMQTRRVQIAADLNNTDVTTNIVVNAGALGFKDGDLFYIEATGEIVYVTPNPASDTTLTVIRGMANTLKTALTVASQNPYMTCIGSAYEEASNAPVGIAFDPNEQVNYTQIFRNTHEITNTAAETNLRTGDEWKEQKRETLELHSVDMERAFWFGKKSVSVRNGKPWRTTGGILGTIPSANIHTYNTAISLDQFENDLVNIFAYGSSEKMAFGGNRALITMQQMLRRSKGALFEMQGDTEYGMKVTRFTYAAGGTLAIKTHPLFNQMKSGVGYAAMDAALIVLDMAQIKYKYLKNRDTKYETDLQTPGVDGKKNGFRTECGIQVGQAITHYAIFGLTAAVAES